jgi:hypothetical protein
VDANRVSSKVRSHGGDGTESTRDDVSVRLRPLEEDDLVRSLRVAGPNASCRRTGAEVPIRFSACQPTPQRIMRTLLGAAGAGGGGGGGGAVPP